MLLLPLEDAIGEGFILYFPLKIVFKRNKLSFNWSLFVFVYVRGPHVYQFCCWVTTS